jgi:basic membrane protein A
MVSSSAKYSIFRGIIVVLVVISIGFAVMSSSPLSSGQVVNRAAMVTDGSIDDNGWGLLHYKGLLALKDELGFEIALSELLPPAEWETAPRSYAENQYDYVLLAGGQFTTIAAKIAPDYPDTTFIVTAAAPPAEGTSFPSNMIGIDLMNEQSAYLGGILAAGMTKTNKIGAIGGIDFPYLLRWNEAFKLGAVTQNPNVTIFEAYTGSFEDVSRGYEATRGQIDAGADVIWHNLDLGAVGVVNALKESPGVWLISNTNDQSFLAPEVTLTSTLQNMTNLILNGVKGVESGTLSGGEFHRWGIKEGAAGLAPYHQTEGMIPADLKAKIEDLKIQMTNGTFTVPLIYERDGYRNYT